MNKTFYPITKVENDIKTLIKNLKKSEIDFENFLILGIGRGGLMAAQYIAYAFDNHNLKTVGLQSYEMYEQNNIVFLDEEEYYMDIAKKNENILIVDDLYDSGNTINYLVNKLYLYNGELDIKAAVIYKHESHYRKEEVFFSEYYNQWIIFPWDKI